MAERAGSLRVAWILTLFALGIVPIYFGLVIMLRPNPMSPADEAFVGASFEEIRGSNPRLAEWIRQLHGGIGGAILGYGILAVGISLKAYRRGERWAWYVLLLGGLPTLSLLTISLYLHHPPTDAPLLILYMALALFVAGLALPAREILFGASQG